MSSLQYHAYEGAGAWMRRNLGFSQAVRVGDRIECSGQGGWELPEGTDYPIFKSELREEIGQAFRNVETALKDAGGQGWSQVFRVNSYHTEITEDLTAMMTEEYRKWMPDHAPIWTQIGVRQLGAPEMRIELEVVAYDPSK